MRSTLILFILIFSFSITFGQQFIRISNKSGSKRKVINVGDPFIYKLYGDETVYRDQLVSVTDSTFQLTYETLKPEEVQVVYKNETNYMDRLSGYLIAGGAILVAIDFVNIRIVNNAEFEPSSGIFIVGGAMVGTGLIYKLLRRRKYRLDKRWDMNLINIDSFQDVSNGSK
ncbi:hypothetical protein OO013_05895 [Mangrovivirga sp. M17]|uniref:Uncharacterized protein n=1 Tax=Mangrovivirga halotolerans TaxID=2993936 RepID=A0ABT3RPC9_9BACT|nr:hypothetical protein [Mangrovivirga halotolerans]MCX2743388.1 hypothetical protein [Mangrovivirga halotolerans]